MMRVVLTQLQDRRERAQRQITARRADRCGVLVAANIFAERSDLGDLRRWHGALAVLTHAGSGLYLGGHVSPDPGDVGGEFGFPSKLVVSNEARRLSGWSALGRKRVL